MTRTSKWTRLPLSALVVVLTLSLVALPALHAQRSEPATAPRLPATDMGSGRAREWDRLLGLLDDASAGGFANARPARNPMAAHATPVGAATCAGCHALETLHASHSQHVSAFLTGSAGVAAPAACEACHGPGSEHARQPAVRGSIIAYTQGGGTPVAVQAATCMGCHAGGARQHWTGSIHERRGLSCTDCHNPMVRLSPEGMLSKPSVNEVCATCHRDVRVQFNRRSHMPLPEGRLSCADCHNPHGGFSKPLLKTATVNETCFSCHADKRGPFLFEHAPLRDSCLTCHTPHGSNHANLTVLPVPMLCRQCHVNSQHVNDLLTRQGLRSGIAPDERVMGRACLNCHANIHGSNHPAGATFVK